MDFEEDAKDRKESEDYLPDSDGAEEWVGMRELTITEDMIELGLDIR